MMKNKNYFSIYDVGRWWTFVGEAVGGTGNYEEAERGERRVPVSSERPKWTRSTFSGLESRCSDPCLRVVCLKSKIFFYNIRISEIKKVSVFETKKKIKIEWKKNPPQKKENWINDK